MCSQSQSITDETQNLIQFTVERVGPGSDALSLGSDGAFRTAFFEDGEEQLLFAASTISIPNAGGADPTPTATPLPTSTPAPTAPAATGGGGGGGAPAAPQPTATAIPFVAPGPPVDVQATPGDGAATITWQAPEDDGGALVSSYFINIFGTSVTATLASTARSHTLTGLENGVAIQVRVRAVNAAGNGEYSALVSVTPAGVPDSPTGVSASVVDGNNIFVDWDDSGTNGTSVTGYTVTEVDGKLQLLQTGPGTTSATHEGVPPGTYSFEVHAESEVGAGESSAATAPVTVEAPPVIQAPGEPDGSSSEEPEPIAIADIEPEGPEFSLRLPIREELENAFNEGVALLTSMTEGNLGLTMDGDSLQLILPLTGTGDAGLDEVSVDLITDQFSISSVGLSTSFEVPITDELNLQGAGQLGWAGNQIVVNISTARLIYEPQGPTSTNGVQASHGRSVTFEVDLISSPEAFDVQVEYAAEISGFGREVEAAILLAASDQQLSLSDSTDAVALVARVEKLGLSNDQLGSTVVAFVVDARWVDLAALNGETPYIVKINDSLEVFFETASCTPVEGDSHECRAEFNGEAGGFSSFGLVMLSSANGPEQTSTQEPTVATAPTATPSSTNTPEVSPTVEPTASPLPVPTPALFGDDQEGDGGSAAVVVALVLAGVVVAALVVGGGYRYRRSLSRSSTGIIVISIAASVIAVTVSSSPDSTRAGYHSGPDSPSDHQTVPGLVVGLDPRNSVEPGDAGAAVAQGAERLVTIDAVSDVPAALLSELKSLGLQNEAVYRNAISGRLPQSALEQAQSSRNARYLNVSRPILRTGSVTSQGDSSIRADLARASHGVDGSDVRIGVISDSFDCLLGANFDTASGDLPRLIEFSSIEPFANIQLDQDDCHFAMDEGRALMQIIHDVAPGASMYFRSGVFGQAAMANAISELADFEVTVIVDDITYLNEPYFQDGILAQAVDEVTKRGVVYVTAAGNDGRRSYESEFRPGASLDIDAFGSVLASYQFLGGTPHDFDPDGLAEDVLQSVTVPTGDFLIGLQWDEPAASAGGAGSSSQVDAYLLDESGTMILAAFVEETIDGDPLQVLGFSNTGSEFNANLAIVHRSGPIPGRIKWVSFYDEPLVLNEFATDSSTIVGHANAAGAITVGAAFYGDTPEFGQSPPLIQPYSSAGGTPILFDTAGVRIPAQIRQKPDVVGPDGVNTTFFGADIAGDADDSPNFFGTSASAAHAAGVIALMIQANTLLDPEDVKGILGATAIDMDGPGADTISGFGLIDADAAIGEAKSPSLDRGFLIKQEVNDIALHDDGRIFATVPSDADSFPDSIVLIDPVTGIVTPYITFASDENPNVMAISEDGTVMHVGLDREDGEGPGAIQQVDLVADALITGTPGSLIELGFAQSDPSVPVVAEDIESIPDSSKPKTIAVSLVKPRRSPSHDGVVVFDDGVMRTNRTTDPWNPAHDIEFTVGGTEIVGARRDTFPSTLIRMSVDADGVSIISSLPDTRGAAEFQLFDGLLYFESGVVFDPQTLGQVTDLNTGFDQSWPAMAIFRDSRRIAFTQNPRFGFDDGQMLGVFDLDSGQQTALVRLIRSGIPQPDNFTSLGGGRFLISGDSGKILSVRTGAVDPDTPGLTVASDELAFSALVGETSGPQVTVVTNRGPGPLTISSVTETNDWLDQFSITVDNCSGATLNDGESCSISTAFAPTLRHEPVVTIEIASNAGTSPDTIKLRGLAAELVGPGETVHVGIDINELLRAPDGETIFASVDADFPTYGGSVVQIDPETGLIHSPIFIGEDPRAMAVSEDMSTLYVGFYDGDLDARTEFDQGAIAEVDLATSTVVQTIPLGRDGNYPLIAGDIELLPGTTKSIAVAKRLWTLGSSKGVFVFDDGVQRSASTPDSGSSHFIEFIDGDTLFGYEADRGYTPQLIDIDGTGAAIVLEGTRFSATTSSSFESRVHDGLAYMSTGHVHDLSTLDVVANTEPGADSVSHVGFRLLEIDPSSGKVFQAVSSVFSNPFRLDSFDLATLAFIDSIPLNVVSWSAEDLYRWGPDGLIFAEVAGGFTRPESPSVVIMRSVVSADSRPVGTLLDLQGVSGLVEDVELSADPGSGSPVQVPVTDAAQFRSVLSGTYEFTLLAPGFLPRVLSNVTVGPAGASLPPTQLRPGDANSDNTIDDFDAAIVADSFARSVVERLNAEGHVVDLDGDGAVTGLDASLLSSNLGLTGPMGWLDSIPDPFPPIPIVIQPVLVDVQSDPVRIGDDLPNIGDSEVHVLHELADSRIAPIDQVVRSGSSIFRVKRVIYPGDGTNPPIVEVERAWPGVPRDIKFTYRTDGLVVSQSELEEPDPGLRSVESTGSANGGAGYDLSLADGTDVVERLTGWGDTATVSLSDQPNAPIATTSGVRLINPTTGLLASDLAVSRIVFAGDGTSPPVLEVVQIGPNPATEVSVQYHTNWAVFD